MNAYYNDKDRFVVRWLRNLLAAGYLPQGDVDDRPIEEVEANDVRGYTQCHFFAGLGGWALALQRAGWPADQPVWTGSCPCQPFSSAGKRQGTIDKRHLWPEWFRLITQCLPPTVFGEQVASPAGRAWLATVRTEMETLGYAFGAADLCAAGVGAPHIRQRLWFVVSGLANTESKNRSIPIQSRGSQQTSIKSRGSSKTYDNEWSGCDWIPCRDGKTRPIEPGTLPLVNGIPFRMGRLRAYGNAIVPAVGAMFVKAYMEI